MKNKDIDIVIKILRRESKKYDEPVVTRVSRSRSPFQVLISCLLSLRTKDAVTSAASKRLFELARTPEEMMRLSKETIINAIYPVGFYRTKAANILNICKTLVQKYDSKVPDELDELLKLKGVGRKTANLVITLGYRKLGICVDTHVHRISNRLGYVQTKTPEETEFALRAKLPQKYWIIYNDLLVTHGQNVCRPISPFCSICKIERYCPKVGVTSHR